MKKYKEALKIYSALESESTVGRYTPQEYREARMMLEELVEKETPKEPKLDEEWFDEDTTSIYDEYGRINEILCVCPNCGKKTIYDFEYRDRFKYCPSCGQALDWSDEE